MGPMKRSLVSTLAICSTLLAGCFIAGGEHRPPGGGGANTGGTGGGDTGGGDTGGGGSVPTDGSIVCGGALGFEAASPWPMEGCCPDRRSRTSFAGPQNPELAWQHDLGAEILTSPVVDNEGWIYVITDDGNLDAIMPDGTLGWAYNFAPTTKTRGAPAIGEDGTLYFGAETGIFAVTLDGDQVWVHNAGGNKSSALIGPDRTVYVYSTNGTLYALGPDGNPRWTLDTPPWGTTSELTKPRLALGAAGTLYLGLSDGGVLPVGQDGKAQAPIPKVCSGSVLDVAVAGNGTVYVQCEYHTIALSPGGTKAWDNQLTYEGRLAITPANGVIARGNGSILSLDAMGDQLWAAPVYGNTAGVALDGNGFVYFAGADGFPDSPLRIVTDQGKDYWQYDSDPAVGSHGAAVIDGAVIAPVGTTVWMFDSK